MKEILIIVLVIIGAFIGAGFASGQEIYSFFFIYGPIGIVGILISCLIMTISVYKILKIVKKEEIDSYSQFLEKYIKNQKIIKIINIILNILLLITFYIMIAGFGAYFEQELGINKIIGSLILSILCALIFMTDVRGVLKVSQFLVTILIVFIILIRNNQFKKYRYPNNTKQIRNHKAGMVCKSHSLCKL